MKKYGILLLLLLLLLFLSGIDYKSYANSSFSEVFPKEELEGAGRLQAFTFASSFLENKNAGRFEENKLPLELQMAPIYGFVTSDFDKNGTLDVLAVGNFYGNQVKIGKLDVSYGSYLSGNGGLSFNLVEPRKSGFAVRGEARDIKILRGPEGKKWVLVARNNGGVSIFEY